MSTNQNKNSKHNYFMGLALYQAMKSLGNTETNPSVGCIIVKNNSVIAAGSTGFKGTPHAEVMLLILIKKKLKTLNYIQHLNLALIMEKHLHV